MARADTPPTDRDAWVELAMFLALLVPTLVVLAAAVVSLAHPEPSVAIARPVQTTAACEPCRPYEPEEEDDAER